MEFKPIGIIHTPYKTREGVPIQPAAGAGRRGEVEVFPEYSDGLRSLEGFDHIILIYHLHLSKEYSLEVIPFLDTEKRGLFATRAPARPNQIGISIVRLTAVKGNILEIRNVDMIDGTPLLDIKPFVPDFDCFDIKPEDRYGWLEKSRDRTEHTHSDDRFTRKNRKE